MLEYRRQPLNSDVPANLQTIAKRLIPPKGIRRKNIEGSKQLDYMEGEPTIDDLEPAEQSDNDEQFSSDEESDQENVDQDQDKLPTNHQCHPNSALSHLFQNICNDPEVNKDVKFLDNLRKVFEGNETSIMFKPHLNKVKSAFYEARRSVKKRILTELTLTNNEITKLMQLKIKTQAL